MGPDPAGTLLLLDPKDPGGGAPRDHPAEALLHAYVAGEVDPAQRAAIAAHLNRCPGCVAVERRIAAMRNVFQTMNPPELDDLRWRWMGQRIRARLQDEASHHLPAPAGFRGDRLWVPLAAIGALGLTLLLVLRPADGPTAPTSLGERPGQVRAPTGGTPAPLAGSIEATESAGAAEPTLHGNRTPELRLTSGISLKMSPDALLLARTPNGPHVEFDLELGELDVELPTPPGPESSFTVRTPAYVATARATHFSLGYRPTDYFVSVREGEVEIEGDAFPPGTTIHAGESRMVRVVDRTERAGAAARAGTKDGALGAPTWAPAHRGGHSRDLVPPLRGQDRKSDRMVSSSEGETRVEVVEPEKDPVADAWARASNAYYESRDLEMAIRIASDLARNGGARPEVRQAREMLCEAFIATHQPKRAVEACAALLGPDTSEESAREIHYRLATLYRTQLADCKSAVQHYGRAMVFGGASMLDDEVLLGRAECLLELGDLAGARSDVAILDSHAGALARPLALGELKRRLGAIVRSAEKSKD